MEPGVPPLPDPSPAEERRSEEAIELVHFLVKEVEWIRLLSGRLRGDRKESRRSARDVERIHELSCSVSRSMRRYLGGARAAEDPLSAEGREGREIGSLIEHSIEHVAKRGSSARIVAEVEEAALRIRVPGELLVAVVAVLENAVDFSPPGGDVAIRVRSEGDDIAIEIEDSGPGMTPDVLATCRHRGFTTRAGAGGEGFGLYAAMRILERHRGRLRLESELGVGTRAVLAAPQLPVPTREG